MTYRHWQYFELINNMDGTANHQKNLKAIREWCESNFGSPKENGWEIITTESINRRLGIGGRVTHLQCRFFTSNPEFITLFKLRWINEDVSISI